MFVKKKVTNIYVIKIVVNKEHEKGEASTNHRQLNFRHCSN